MKTIEFFKEKAFSFLTELNDIEITPYNLGRMTGDIYKDSFEDENAIFNSQTAILKEIKFQITLMFAEFDRGHLFVDELNKSLESDFKKHSLDNTPLKQELIKINEKFIKFIEEYRD